MSEGVYRRNLMVPFLKLVCDAVAIELAVVFSYYLRFSSKLSEVVPVTKGVPPFELYMAFSLALVAICLFLFAAFNSYRSRFFSRFSQDIPQILKTCLLGILIAMSGAFLYRGFSFSRIVFVLIFANMVIFLLVERYVFHRMKDALLKRGLNRWRIVLIGSPAQLLPVYNRLSADTHHFMSFVGYICDEQVAELPLEWWPGWEAMEESPETAFDGILLAFDQREHRRILDILAHTEGRNIEIFYVPDILDILTSRFHTIEAGGIPILQLKSFVLSGWQGLLKRSFDILVSAGLLVGLSPILLLIALVIKATSRGPVLYRQRRVGLDGREFQMLKFRSMRTDAESQTGPVWTVENDPRVTWIGRLLRRSSMDELPQLINVVRGDMSLVGPRPERQYFVDQFREFVPHYIERHRVRCGMTGWAQVNGLRGQSPIEERTRYDLYYIENWSLAFDLKILIMTILEIIRGENAY